jgi:hypothetical protein
MVERWPHWSTLGDIRHILMPSGFRHGDGWFAIRSRLCEDLEPLVKEFERAIDCKFEILQVKGNFGGLRIHVNHANDAIRQRIEAAEQEPFRTCEVCRQRGIGGKAAGLRLCATSTPAHTGQEIMDCATHDQRLHFCIARATWVAAA